MILKTYRELYAAAQGFASGSLTFVIIEGRGGIGKSFTVEAATEHANPITIKGRLTAYSLYETIRSNPDALIILDDVDAILQDKHCVALLKQLCELHHEKTITYYTKHTDENTFISNNSVLMLLNDVKTKNKDLAALFGRAHKFEFKPSREEIIAAMRSYADDEEVLDAVLKYSLRSELNLRMYDLASQAKEAGGNWREYLALTLGFTPCEFLVEEIKDLPIEERNAAWLSRSGKSLRTLQRYLNATRRHGVYGAFVAE